MNVRLTWDKRIEQIELEDHSSYQDILIRLELNPDSFIITIKGRPVPLTEKPSDGDEIKLIRVASGG